MGSLETQSFEWYYLNLKVSNLRIRQNMYAFKILKPAPL